jgi:hypothetical protein
MRKLSIVISCFIFLMGCSNQEKKWDEVYKVNKIIAYNEYINLFPNSPYIQAAKYRISDLIEQMIFNRFFNEVSQPNSKSMSGWTYYGNMDISNQSKWEKLGPRTPKTESINTDYPLLWNGGSLDTIVFQKISWDLKMGSDGYGIPIPGKTTCVVKFTDSSLEISCSYTINSNFKLESMRVSENSVVQLKSGEKYRYIKGHFEK